MSDCSIILEYLSDKEWHNVIDIMKDLKPNSRNWAVRSRISDLNKKGNIIEPRIGDNGCAEYRLILLANPQEQGVKEVKEIKVEFDSKGQGTFFNETRD